ncbi:MULTISPECIES: cobaltochelatase subunit CobN [unclassified Microbulbifer]|uniref:cobaltochelatase subunit CobN n=1 Tax=unclassified Microbulbifer TaxID=2619833 RepID=UPI0027E4C4FE|nr:MULTISPECIES: cobaltochelatase subunit CobN [unclassified Microbulbifer]
MLLANETVTPGMLATLRQLGATQRVAVSTAHVDDLRDMPTKARLAVIFAPSHDLAPSERLTALRRELEAGNTPLVVIHRDQLETERIPVEKARPIASYLSEGGKANMEALFQYLTGPLWGRHDKPAPDPIHYPEQGFYHPDYEGLVFTDVAAYREWYGDFSERPVIGIAIHENYLRDTMTAWIDTAIASVEAAGAVPLPFFMPVRGEGRMTAMLAPDGQPLVDALLFFRVSLNPEGRAGDFASLGVPVLQGLIYRDGDENDWRRDQVGFPRGSTPFYFTMAEMAGVTDATVVAAERRSDRQIVAVQPELDILVRRALNTIALQRLPNRDKRLGIYIYNYPQGDSNFSASNLNVPASLLATFEDLARAGYQLETPSLDSITEAGKRLVSAYYLDADRDALLADDLATLFPLADYKAWLATRGETFRQQIDAEWDVPERAPTLVERDGKQYFVIPRLKLGNIALLPQPSRALKDDPERQDAYHDTDLPFSHDYLASYAWLHRAHQAHALIHFGTHGSAEFGPGKARGLAHDDAPHAVLGELPHIYPYIVDNLAESTLAKRRMRATIISHQTPPFAPAALYHELVDLHNLAHHWMSMDDGAARENVREQIVALSESLSIHADLGFAQVPEDFTEYLHALHRYIHAMAQQSEPIGLHTLGRAGKDEHLLSTTMQMLGDEFYHLTTGRPAEIFVGDFATAVTESEPYKLLQRHLLEDAPTDSLPAPLRKQLETGRGYLRALQDQRETRAIIRALDGKYIPPSVGGDPLRNPDSLPTGRNLYGFDPSRVPTRAAYKAGKELLQTLIDQHVADHGRPPRRLAFTLWAMEVMRHHGVIEGQVLAALGVEPVWNERGRLEGVELIPRKQLGRPRIDVVLQASGLYRDAFANTLGLLAQAASLAAAQEEADNPVRALTLELETQLQEAGVSADAVRRLSRTRAFSAAPGQYGIGLDDAVADVDAWADGEQLDEERLGRIFLDRLQHAYGPDPDHWGETLPGINLFERQLAGVEATVFARSSNLYGLLSSDDPFQYLGGLSLGVEVAGGQRPELYIGNLRDPRQGLLERADQFLSREIRTRYHHPRWLQSMVNEGYSGTTVLQDSIENLWGWQALAPEMVRDDQWQRFFEVYAQDAYELGLEKWFEAQNPQALTRIMERMLDAIRTGHWQADEATRKALLEQYRQWAEQHGEGDPSSGRQQFVAEALAGFGLTGEAPADAAGTSAPQPIRGQIMTPSAQPSGGTDWQQFGFIALLALLFLSGAWRQHRRTHAVSTHSDIGEPA